MPETSHQSTKAVIGIPEMWGRGVQVRFAVGAAGAARMVVGREARRVRESLMLGVREGRGELATEEMGELPLDTMGIYNGACWAVEFFTNRYQP